MLYLPRRKPRTIIINDKNNVSDHFHHLLVIQARHLTPRFHSLFRVEDKIKIDQVTKNRDQNQGLAQRKDRSKETDQNHTLAIQIKEKIKDNIEKLLNVRNQDIEDTLNLGHVKEKSKDKDKGKDCDNDKD